MWYLDCYCWAAMGGREFPVNSYFNESSKILLAAADRVLGNDLCGINEVRISRETKGQCPVRAYLPVVNIDQ